MDVKSGLMYTKDHEWVKEVSDNVVRIGITDFAQDQLGDVVFVELPELNARVNKGEAFSVVESVKAASDVYSPVTGTIVAVNTELEENPELINESPYDRGWIVEVKLDELDFSDLMTAKEYESYLKEV